ncbi:cysteine--tRNA ligase [Mesorhizobium microcysteis]|uniref:Cysteine--tRNA ligase n=1 Tax=Neoaquamicrobium microcysteis TaxID=2682781 RepID=A0A5D4GVP3_9HYPH|nr:cysteine--tRNA ligase [Mesorhizobium microcysteis]TYR32786.1 cysteine--tRNA ligase [Mesorhizobium microcysteis]
MSETVGQLRLYNTLTRTKEAFVPIDPDNVRMYVCGPTVYDFAHIGNARPVIVFDVLYRLLRHVYGDDHVTYVRNITDVDDKINARALRDFGGEIADGRLSLNDAIRKVTEKTAHQFHADVKALGCLEPTFEPRATEHIEGMVAMAQALIDRGNAYVAHGAEGREVLFDVSSMPDYGRLSNRQLEDQQAGARVEVKDHKKNPGDFVLWKESAADQPGWPAHFHFEGQGFDIFGRPGWHIECSVMSRHHLGDVFDIHGGGLDLIFPHHENELAQSRCAHGTEVMAKVWMHNGFLQVEGRKMSKSEGNFVTISELLHTEKFGGRKWPGEVLRLAMLMTHYREPIDFSVRKLEEAEALIAKWRRKAAGHSKGPLDAEFVEALSDDIDMSRYLRLLNAHDLDPSALLAAAEMIGLNVAELKTEVDVAEFVSRRLTFIRDKNWAEADRIRDELLAQGVQLKDGKDPATGERVTTWEVVR